MIYTRPFITKRFIAYAGESRRTELSLAVQIIDSFTQEQPDVTLSVRLKELPAIRPLRGQSGFYCFEGRETVAVNGTIVIRTPIPNGNYTLIVEPDPTAGNRFHLQPRAVGQPWTNNFERALALPLPNPLRPLELVTLSPTPAYPFPANATLVRGVVRQGGTAAANAVVSSRYEEVDPADATLTIFHDVETLTDREGEFALFFKRLPLKTQLIPLKAVKGTQVQVSVSITEGKTLKNQILNLP